MDGETVSAGEGCFEGGVGANNSSSSNSIKCGRWNPTAEQVKILTELFRSGLRTPSTDQIQRISSHLSAFGKIESKNVFYWFQNHKARERLHHKKRRRAPPPPPSPDHHHPHDDFMLLGMTADHNHNHINININNRDIAAATTTTRSSSLSIDYEVEGETLELFPMSSYEAPMGLLRRERIATDGLFFLSAGRDPPLDLCLSSM